MILQLDEVHAFWTANVPLEACYVPDDELRRALAESRVQIAYSTSSMGTAETWWRRASGYDPSACREDGVVVPPGQQATQWEESLDDRNSLRVLWDPFWKDQTRALAAAIPEAKRDTMLEECARALVVLEREWPHDGKHRDTLLDWLVAGDRIDLEKELAAHTTSANRHLARGVRARWLERDIVDAFNAVMDSALRFDDSWRRTKQRPLRLALLRFGVELAR